MPPTLPRGGRASSPPSSPFGAVSRHLLLRRRLIRRPPFAVLRSAGRSNHFFFSPSINPSHRRRAEQQPRRAPRCPPHAALVFPSHAAHISSKQQHLLPSASSVAAAYVAVYTAVSLYIMIYTAINNFYLTDEELRNSPSRKDAINESTETMLRLYGCDLIQESGILLRLPQAVMATGQVLFHRFYCKKSFARFSVKRVAASCVWLASKLEESPRKAKYVIVVFHRMECRRESLPIEHLDVFSKKYSDLKSDLIRTERHLLKEMGFICHVEHPHKFISNYLATLGAPLELRQEAWNLANDSLRTTLCVRFKSEVVACGVVYAAARRFQVPLPENPPWWLVFDADQSGIEEVCRVLAHLYSLPKAQYTPVYKDNDSFTSVRTPHPQAQVSQENAVNGAANDSSTPMSVNNQDSSSSKDAIIKAALDKLKDSKKSDDDSKSTLAEVDKKEDNPDKSKSDHKSDANAEKNREREKERMKARERDSRGRDSDRDRDRENRSHRSKDKSSGHSEKLRHHSSRDRSEYHISHSRDKDRHRHHTYS